MAQLFGNLVENSFRYTDSPGVLRISSLISSGSLGLIFEDSAPGVPRITPDLPL